MFQKAVRTQRKLKMCLFGPSGGGKTFTGLTILRNIVGPEGRIAVIDTEASSASVYADRFVFDVCPLAQYGVGDYVAAIEEAVTLGYDGLLIDSVTHAWNSAGGILERVEEWKKAHRGQNEFQAWAYIKPDETRLWAALTKSPIHLICTMRSKTEYEISKDEKGKTKVEKLGLAPIQRQDTEYEFDVVARMEIDNTLVITKTRCEAINGRAFDKPGKEFAGLLSAWLSAGEAPTAPPAQPAAPGLPDIHRDLWNQWIAMRDKYRIPPDTLKQRCSKPFREMDPEEISRILDAIESEFCTTEPQEEVLC